MLPKALLSPRPSVSRSLVSKARSLAIASTMLLAGSLAAPLAAQTASSSLVLAHAPADRLTQPIVESNRVALGGTLHPLANKANDRGAVADGMKLDRMQVVLKRSDAQEAALKQLIGEMHQKGSANYRKWLTPDDFGKQFGPSDADVAKLESWLGSHGFSITKLNPGRQTLEIAGTAGQFRDTFHAPIHTYQVKGVAGTLETHYANSAAPEIPAALAPVFGGFASLNNFRLKSNAHSLGKAQYNRATHEAKPDWTYGTTSGYSLVVAPADLAVQYDLDPLYSAGTKGDGQSIAIVNEANINIALVNNYRALFGLPFNPPQVIIDGNDPGVDGINSPYGPNGASLEAYLDVEVAGAVAPNAQINLVIADSTALEDGLALAAQRAVYSDISPVLSLSFGNCEANLQSSGNAFWSNLWEQAAAQGITVTVSSGDSGSAACDDDTSQQFAVRGQAVSGIASTPYNVAVGGTDFYYSGGSGDFAQYWSLANPTTSAATESLTARIPEQPFNSSQYGLDIFPSSTSSGTTIFAAGGGASTLGLQGTGPYPKPSWQVGAGTTNDTVRDLPDVSLFGSLDTNGSYTPICADDGDCLAGSVVQISSVGGTSVSAPEFAGMMALVNQRYGRQGQANFVLYPLSKQFPAAFNDVVKGTVAVPCATTTTQNSNTGITYPAKNCQIVTGGFSITDDVYGTTTEGEIGFSANTPAYSAVAGYDLASGLGSVDAYNMVTNWNKVTLGATATTLTPSSISFAHGTAVTISGSVTGSNPTGDVGLISTSTDTNSQGQTFFPLVSGTYSGSVNYLPGGTYNISGYYAGDGSNAASSSTPVSITVTPEASTTLVQVYSAPNANSNLNPIASGSNTYTYGIPLIVSAQPKNSAGKITTYPTGSVVFSDNAKAINTAVVNVEGDAEYNAAFSPGPHNITAAYSGDGSYAASTSSAVTLAVAKATPVIVAIDYNSDQDGEAIVTTSGATFTVFVENTSSFSGLPFAAPSGTLTLSGAPSGTTASATLTPGFDPNTGYPAGVAIFSVPSSAALKSYTFTFSYSGDTNYNTTSSAIPETLNTYTGGLASTTAATANAAATSPAARVIVSVMVTGQASGGAPTGAVYLAFGGSGNNFYYSGLGNLTASGATTSTATIQVDSGALEQGTNQLVAFYVGDKTYYPSSAPLTIANPLSDFSLVPLTTILSVANSGATPGVQTDTINLASYNGFAGAVGLTCTASGGVTCSLGTSSATLASGGAASTTLTVNTSGVTKAGTYNVVVTGTDPTGKFVHTIGLQVVTPVITVPSFTLSGTAVNIANAGQTGPSTITATPTKGFTGTIALSCAIAAGPSGAASAPTCSATSLSVMGTAAVTGPLTFNTTASTTPGTYTVTVTGTGGSVAPTTTVLVTVGGGAAPGTFSLSNSAAITVATQGGAGSSTISVTPGSTNPYAGVVALTCAVTASPAGAINLPTCSLSPASVTLAGAASTSTLTISTTAQTTTRLDLPLKGIFTAGGGVALAALLFFGVPVGRRGQRALRAVRTLRILSAALLFAMIAGAGIGCGGGTSSGGGGGSTPTGGTTTGAYTITVTGTPASGTAQTVTVAVTIN